MRTNFMFFYMILLSTLVQGIHLLRSHEQEQDKGNYIMDYSKNENKTNHRRHRRHRHHHHHHSRNNKTWHYDFPDRPVDPYNFTGISVGYIP